MYLFNLCLNYRMVTMKIFISYRRDDARADPRDLENRLQRIFGKKSVFMDVDNLLPGQQFDQQLSNALDNSDLLLAVIGSKWLEILLERITANELDNVTKASKVMGYSRQQFYEIRRNFQTYGAHCQSTCPPRAFSRADI